MGGRFARSASTLAISAALLASSSHSSVVAAPAESCVTVDLLSPAPYPVDAVVVDVRWGEHFGEQQVIYSILEPDGGSFLWQAAGCKLGALDCNEYEPLVLISPDVSADPESGDFFQQLFLSNNAKVSYESGTFSVATQAQGACVHYDGDEPYYSGFPASLPVTVTVSYYRAGEAAPCEIASVGPVGIPAITSSWIDDPAPELVLATFEWGGSAAEICAGADATAAVLPGLDPRIGAVVAAAPPGPDGTETTGQAPDDAEAQEPSSRRDQGQRRTNMERFVRLLLGLGAAAFPGPNAPEADRAAALEQLIGAGLLYWFLTGEELLPDPGSDTDEAETVRAHTDDGSSEDVDVDSTSAEDAAAPEQAVKQPTKPPPSMSAKALEQDRSWVWLPDEAAVRKKGATHWLKPGAWYQEKTTEDGVQVFYDRKGKLVGRSRTSIPVRQHWAESLDFDPDEHSGPATETEAAIKLLGLLVEVTTGSEVMKPEGPPPELPSELEDHYWQPVYVPYPAQAHGQRADGDHVAHLLLPGRWYFATSSMTQPGDDGWVVADDQGVELGEVYGEDTIQRWEPPQD